MKREEMADLTAFVVVAEERNFTRAAAKLGISQSALSQIIQRLERRLGLRLLTRTTRSVAPTDAGEKLMETLVPTLDELDSRIAALGEMRGKLAGNIRITSVEHAAKTILCPALPKILTDNPDIHVEVVLDYGLADIVSSRYDAGIRLGSQVAKDMIAVQISPTIPMAIVGSPDYFSNRPLPLEPQHLTGHLCINLRLPTSDSDYTWPLAKNGRTIRAHVQGQLTFNLLEPILLSCLNGLGLGFLPLDQVEPHIADGRLISVLEDWIPHLPPYHIYYPSRRATPAFKLLVEALRYRTP